MYINYKYTLLIKLLNEKKKNYFILSSIEDGGVENFFIIANYLASKQKNISLITASRNLKKIEKLI